MPYKDPKAQLIQQNNYRNNDRQFRRQLLSQFCCIACQETDPDLIDWHHVNADEKKMRISSMATGHDVWWNEVLKCIPLCALCHRKIHKDKLCLLPIHL